MSWLVEDITWLVVLAVLAEIGLAIHLFTTGRGRDIWPMAAILFVVGILVLVEHAVVTERERLEATVEEIAVALRSNDVNAVLAHVDPAADELRSRAQWAMSLIHITGVGYFDLRVEISGDTATADFVLRVDGDDPIARSAYPTYLRHFVLTMLRQEGRWLIHQYEVGDPLGGPTAPDAY